MRNLALFFVFSLFFANFSFAQTYKDAPLDNIIKDIEISGALRYCYETQRSKKFDKKTGKHQSTSTTQFTIN